MAKTGVGLYGTNGHQVQGHLADNPRAALVAGLFFAAAIAMAGLPPMKMFTRSESPARSAAARPRARSI